MASSIALKRILASNLLTKALTSPAVATARSASRFFNTYAARDSDDDDDYRNLDVERRSDRDVSGRRDLPPNPFSGAFDPFAPTRSVSQILNMMNRYMNSPIHSASRGGATAGLPLGWDARETGDGLYLRMDMPGLGKEDIKVSIEQNTLIIKGEGEKESEKDEESGRRYTSRIVLPEKMYKTNEIKAEMKNGVLKVVVPKVKEEERTDVFHVKVD